MNNSIFRLASTIIYTLFHFGCIFRIFVKKGICALPSPPKSPTQTITHNDFSVGNKFMHSAFVW